MGNYPGGLRAVCYQQNYQTRVLSPEESVHKLARKVPGSKTLPWYGSRHLVMRAGAVINAEEAWHRALIFRNLGRPGDSNRSRTATDPAERNRAAACSQRCASSWKVRARGRQRQPTRRSGDRAYGSMVPTARSSSRRTFVSLGPFMRRGSRSRVWNAMLAYYVTSSRSDALNCRLLPVEGRGEHVPGAVAVSEEVQHARTRSG